jgi:hypothetical protein
LHGNRVAPAFTLDARNDVTRVHDRSCQNERPFTFVQVSGVSVHFVGAVLSACDTSVNFGSLT